MKIRIISTGNVIVADEAFAEAHYPGDWEALPDDPTPVPAADPRLTRLQYLTRFTDAEAIAIDLASIGATVEAASLRRLAKLVDNAEFIDLTDPRVIGGVQMLEAAGLIGAGRAAEILTP